MRREAAAAREASTAELSLMRRQLASAQTAAADAEAAHAEAEKVCISCLEVLCNALWHIGMLLACLLWHLLYPSIIGKDAFRRMLLHSDDSACLFLEGKYIFLKSASKGFL